LLGKHTSSFILHQQQGMTLLFLPLFILQRLLK
jgi:hypothetical protein